MNYKNKRYFLIIAAMILINIAVMVSAVLGQFKMDTENADPRAVYGSSIEGILPTEGAKQVPSMAVIVVLAGTWFISMYAYMHIKNDKYINERLRDTAAGHFLD